MAVVISAFVAGAASGALCVATRLDAGSLGVLQAYAHMFDVTGIDLANSTWDYAWSVASMTAHTWVHIYLFSVSN